MADSAPPGTCGDDGLFKNPRFPPFSGRLWMLLDEEKRTNGARGRSRTADTAIFSRMLYQLSYPGMAAGEDHRAFGEACL